MTMLTSSESSARPDVCDPLPMRRLLIALAALGVLGVLLVGLTQAGESGKRAGPIPETLDREQVLAPLRGAPEPLAALHRRAGELPAADVRAFRAQLRALRGFPVVVNAWASWCGPCKLEFPLFQRASVRLGKRVAFLGLNVADNRGEAAAFLRKAPVPYPSLVDGDYKLLGVAAPGAQGLPITVFYDARGRRTVHQGGYRSERQLLDDIRRYAGA